MHMRRARWNAYSLEASPLFGLQSKRKLAELLGTNVRNLKSLAGGENNYHKFLANAGTEEERAIQAPHPWIEPIHRRILDLLRRIHPPSYLKSGVRGESIVSNAAAHARNDRGFKFDIRKFYPSVKRSHVFGCFYRTFGMAPDVADLLADLCTVDGALPTGSVLSADLAFYANLQMFEKLSEIASERGMVLTVWIDDITVSGLEARRQVCNLMVAVVQSHGYRCHKKVIFRPGAPRVITGVIVHQGRLLIPNRRHHKLHLKLLELDHAANDQEFEGVARSVLGLMEAADQIEKRYRVRKHILRKELKTVMRRA